MNVQVTFTDLRRDDQFAILAFIVFLICFCVFCVFMSEANASEMKEPESSIFDTVWVKLRPAAKEPYQYYTVTDIESTCRNLGVVTSNRILGCYSIRDGVCRIFTTPHPLKDTIEHEKKHCAGYDHY